MSSQEMIRCPRCGGYRIKQKPTQELVCLDCGETWLEKK